MVSPVPTAERQRRHAEAEQDDNDPILASVRTPAFVLESHHCFTALAWLVLINPSLFS